MNSVPQRMSGSYATILLWIGTFSLFCYQRRILCSKGIEWSHPATLKVLAKFGLCSNCSQKLDECSLARAHKIFARARMLGFSLKFPAVERRHNLHLGNKNWHCKQCFPYGKPGNIGERHARAMNVSGKFLPRFFYVYWNWPAWVQSQVAG